MSIAVILDQRNEAGLAKVKIDSSRQFFVNKRSKDGEHLHVEMSYKSPRIWANEIRFQFLSHLNEHISKCEMIYTKILWIPDTGELWIHKMLTQSMLTMVSTESVPPGRALHYPERHDESRTGFVHRYFLRTSMSCIAGCLLGKMVKKTKILAVSSFNDAGFF
jgi:hypothetical protein